MDRQPGKNEGLNLRLLTININGINDNKIEKLCTLKKYDVILIQETHNGLTKKTIAKIEEKLNGIIIVNDAHPNDKGGGVAIVIKNKKLKWEKIEEIPHFKGRLIHIKIEGLNVINIYMPANKYGKSNFLKDLDKYLSKYSMEKLVIGGDFNWVGDPIDRIGGMNVNDKVITEIAKGTLEKHKLIDIYRMLNLPRTEYTHYYGNQLGSRLDRFYGNYYSPKMYIKSKIKNMEISDHKPVSIKMKVNNRDKWGNGSWKFNNKILENKEFITTIQEKITNFQNSIHWDIIAMWDNLKKKFKKTAINFTKRESELKKKEEQEIKSRLGANISEEIKRDLKIKLNNIRNERERGKVIRAGVYSNLYTYANDLYKREELRRGGEKEILELWDTNKREKLTGKNEILKRVKEFYKELYTSQEITNEQINEYLTGLQCEMISPEHKDLCDEFISAEEIKKTITQLAKGKSPGNDGLTAEFYSKFSSEISPILESLYNNIFLRNKEMASTMKEGLITLIYKGKGEREDLKNWRPISLLNIDYKILSRVLTNRVKNGLKKLLI
jgi:exonuclease III